MFIIYCPDYETVLFTAASPHLEQCWYVVGAHLMLLKDWMKLDSVNCRPLVLSWCPVSLSTLNFHPRVKFSFAMIEHAV